MTVFGPPGGGVSSSSAIRTGPIYGAWATAAQFQDVNPILPIAVLGFEHDTTKVKIGDGVTAWNDLPYWTP
jgi:hypothetical protein